MTDSVPEKLGKYKIIEEVGRGGFAAVYKAMDTTLDRTVALKVLAPHLLWDPTFVQRFQREAKVAANLDHSNIVTIYEVSQVEGVYFIAMQFLEGRTLSQILEAEGPLPVSRVQGIAEQIASALDYAHTRGFVHRDVKPTNVIVADDGRATLTDFGLVKAGEGTKLSTTGVIFGTPEYMSPEQAEGKKLDTRSDVYSLGVVLFEMLAGRAPFMADTTPAVMYKHVHEPPPLDELLADLPQGAVAVVEKALAKDPADRYQSVGQMVKALQRAVAEAPVPAEVAPPPSPAMVEEKPEPEIAPSPLVEPVAVFEEEEEAVPFWQKVPLWGWFAIAVGGLVLLAVAGGVLLGRGSSRVLRGHADRVFSVAWSLDGATLASVESSTVILWDVEMAKQLRTLTGHTGAVSVAWSPDGAALASGSTDGTVVLWDAATGERLRTLTGHIDVVHSVMWSPDGTMLASAGGYNDRTVIVWDPERGKRLRTLEVHQDVLDVAWSPDGATLASGSTGKTVILWDAKTGERLRTLEGHIIEVNSVVWSPDGATLASGSTDGTVILWDAKTGERLRTLEGHTDRVESVAFSPDGVMLASGSFDNTVIVWDAETGERLRTLKGHTDYVWSVAFSPDGVTLASGSGDGTVRLWGVAAN
jgi:Tol biopolymer transport system component